MNTTLYVTNLAQAVSEADLAEVFSSVGEVVAAKIGMQREWGSLDMCGWVTMRDSDSATRAQHFLNGHPFFGHSLKVKPARRVGPHKQKLQ